MQLFQLHIINTYLHGKIAHDNETSSNSTQLQHNYVFLKIMLSTQLCSSWPLLIMSICHRANKVSGGQLYEHSLIIVHPFTLTAL